jgi:hypothetical protein
MSTIMRDGVASKESWLWSRKFLCSFLLQAFLIVIATFILFIYGSEYLTPAPAMIIASGSAGMWLTVGYLIYIGMVLYLGISSSLYYQLEKTVTAANRKKYDLFAILHFVLVNVGSFITSVLLMVAGYTGESALLPLSSGGGGLTELQVHVQILSAYSLPVVVFAGITTLGVLCGIVSFWLACKKK